MVLLHILCSLPSLYGCILAGLSDEPVIRVFFFFLVFFVAFFFFVFVIIINFFGYQLYCIGLSWKCVGSMTAVTSHTESTVLQYRPVSNR